MHVYIVVPSTSLKYFRELIDAFIHNLTSKQIDYTVAYDYIEKTPDIVIFYGLHMFDVRQPIKKNDIIMQLEQLFDDSPYNNAKYLHMLSSGTVWDYNIENIKWLRKKNIKAQHVPILFSPVFKKDIASRTEMDVLFFGTMNERRLKYIQKIRNDIPFLKIVCLENQFSDEKYNLAKSAKVVVNIHYYQPAKMETSRIVPLISNGVFILSENVDDPIENQYWSNMIGPLFTWDTMIPLLYYYLTHPEFREEKRQDQNEKILLTSYQFPLELGI